MLSPNHWGKERQNPPNPVLLFLDVVIFLEFTFLRISLVVFESFLLIFRVFWGFARSEKNPWCFLRFPLVQKKAKEKKDRVTSEEKANKDKPSMSFGLRSCLPGADPISGPRPEVGKKTVFTHFAHFSACFCPIKTYFLAEAEAYSFHIIFLFRAGGPTWGLCQANGITSLGALWSAPSKQSCWLAWCYIELALWAIGALILILGKLHRSNSRSDGGAMRVGVRQADCVNLFI